MRKKIALIVITMAVVAGTVLSGCGKSGTAVVDSDGNIEVTSGDMDQDLKDQVTEMTSDASEGQKSGSFANDYFSFTYDPEYFTVFEDGDEVTASFYNEDVQMAGSNVVSFSVVKGTDAKTVIDEKVDQFGGSQDLVSENYIGGEDNIGYSFSAGAQSSEDSGLTTDETFYAVPSGDDVIIIDGFRTIGTDEETEMLIDDKIAEMLDTFVLTK